MNSADLTHEQLESLKETISKQLHFYEQLLKRMSDTGFPADDPLLLAARTARVAGGSVWSELNERSKLKR